MSARVLQRAVAPAMTSDRRAGWVAGCGPISWHDRWRPGIGRAVAERLPADGDAVVVLDRDEAALGWASAHPAGRRVLPLAGDAVPEVVTGRAADLAQEAGRLAGWVSNAAVFRDAWLDAVPAA